MYEQGHDSEGACLIEVVDDRHVSFPAESLTRQGEPLTRGQLVRALAGASAGAALGALGWFLIEYYARLQAGYLAVVCGALAGWGAVLWARRRGVSIGLLAAAAGVIGILAGSYTSYHAQLRSNAFREEIGAYVSRHTSFLTEVEREQAIDDIHRAAIAEVSYADWIQEDAKNLPFMFIFGVIGLVYGFRVGAGS